MTTTVAIRVAINADQTRSGFFLINRSIIIQADSISPRKVRLAQKNGYICNEEELIERKRALLIPARRTIAKQIINITDKARFILYGDRININSQIKI